MFVSRRADYGIRAMLDVAVASPNGVALTREIATRQGIPSAFLAKIVARLTRGGLLLAQRGAKGGVSLARPANQISLRQIVEAVDGPMALNRCLRERVNCPHSDGCRVRRVWSLAQNNLLTFLDGVTLADLSQPPS